VSLVLGTGFGERALTLVKVRLWYARRCLVVGRRPSSPGGSTRGMGAVFSSGDGHRQARADRRSSIMRVLRDFRVSKEEFVSQIEYEESLCGRADERR